VGFTLTELIIVIAIILILTITALPAVLSSLRDRKFGDTARTIQAALAGARDRAMVSGQIRGLRLVRDPNTPWEVSTLVYIGTPDPYSVGVVQVSGTTVTPNITPPYPDPGFDFVDPGKDNNPLTGADNIPRVVPGSSFIRFDNTGPLYPITSVRPAASPVPARLTIFIPPATAFNVATGVDHTYQIFGPATPLPQDNNVITLPEGAVIDVRGAPMPYQAPYSADNSINIPRSRGIPNYVPPVGYLGSDQILGTPDDLPAETWPTMDILFGPNGLVTGEGSTYTFIHLWVGERADKGPDPDASMGPDNFVNTADDTGPTRPHFMMTLNSRTGAVKVYHNPSTASADTWPPPPAATSSYYMEIYNPARQLFGLSSINVP
jgi:prepilin-type N-terminal cleavage/methylation domain-containing protein